MASNHQPDKPGGMPRNVRADRKANHGGDRPVKEKRLQGRQPANLDDEQRNDHRVVDDADSGDTRE